VQKLRIVHTKVWHGATGNPAQHNYAPNSSGLGVWLTQCTWSTGSRVAPSRWMDALYRR
jgi:hypothetical protein